MKTYLSSFLVVCALFITSCATAPKKTTDEAGILYEKLLVHNRRVYSLKGEAMVVYREPDRTLSFRGFVLSNEENGGFRLDLSDFVFNKPLVTVTRNGGAVLAVMHYRKAYYSASWEEINMKKITGFDIPRELLISTVMGKVYAENTDCRTEGDVLILEGAGAYREHRVYFKDEVISRVVYGFEESEYEVLFQKYRAVEGIEFPQKIVVEMSGEGSVLEILYSQVDLNRVSETDDFSLDGVDLNNYENLSPGV